MNRFEDIIENLLADYVDIVFANEDEAEAYSGSKDPEDALDALSAVCDIAAVKLGPDGAWLKQSSDKHRINPIRANAIDTTGAGDLWASGFLYGHYIGKDLPTSGQYGSLLGSEVVQILGANIPEERWDYIKEQVN